MMILGDSSKVVEVLCGVVAYDKLRAWAQAVLRHSKRQKQFLREMIAFVSISQVSYQHRSHLFNLVHLLDLLRSC